MKYNMSNEEGKGINPCWKGYEMIGMKKKKVKKFQIVSLRLQKEKD